MVFADLLLSLSLSSAPAVAPTQVVPGIHLGSFSGPTIPPGPWDEEPSGDGTRVAEIDMPVCYPCDGTGFVEV